jgi:hypothetical protein
MSITTMRRFAAPAAALAFLAGASVASANSVLQIDVNSLTATAAPGFSTSYTGSVDLSTNMNSELAGILIGGSNQMISGTLDNFTGTINLVNGQVDGGSFVVSVLESDGVTINSYSATINDAAGQVNTQAGQGFSIDGLTFDGTFSSATFAGVDVAKWFDNQPLTGSFIQFAFNPNAQGVDGDSDIDIFVVVPLPAGGMLAFAGLAGLVGVRRRMS